MASVTLPSIQEMFPEHMMYPHAPPQAPPPPPPQPSAFNLSISPPSRFEDYHHPYHSPKRKYSPTLPLPSGRRRSNTTSSLDNAVSTLHFTDEDDEGEGSAGESGGAGGDSTKRHICNMCSKRFNRPSSLRIHVNTHTGAQPFKCPYAGCGRAFNVNSNMRRHYRNHTSNVTLFEPAETPETYHQVEEEPRKKRVRREETDSYYHHQPPRPAAAYYEPPHHYTPAPPPPPQQAYPLHKATWDDSPPLPPAVAQSPTFRASSSSPSVDSDYSDDYNQHPPPPPPRRRALSPPPHHHRSYRRHTDAARYPPYDYAASATVAPVSDLRSRS